MKLKNILLTLAVIFLVFGIFIYIEPSITGLVTQERFLINDVKVSAVEFDQEIKVEQFDEHEIKFDNALYYFLVKPEYEQDINYLLVEFMVDSSQVRDYSEEDVNVYYYDEEWKELETEFVKQYGRFYYYTAEAEEFGLFVVAPVRKEKVAAPVSRNDLILFALLPVFVILLLFIIFSYGSVRLIQKLNYRFYLALKKGFIGLIKFGLSLGIVVLILDLISIDKQGSVSGVSLIYYAVIPLLILSLLSDVILNFVLWIHRLIKVNRVYRIFRNSSLLFVFVLAGVFLALYKFVPKQEGVLSGNEIILFGLIPVVIISSFIVFVCYSIYVLTKRVFVHE